MELPDGSKGHWFIMTPMVGWLGLNAMEFLGPHEHDGGAMWRASRDSRQKDRHAKLMAKLSQDVQVASILAMCL